MIAGRIFAAAALAACAAPALAQDELLFPLDEAPQGALEAATAAAPDATFIAVDVEVEDGVITLEFAGLNPDGKEIEVDVAVASDVTWVLDEVEEVIPFEDVPEIVRQTLAIEMGEQFTPQSVEKSVRDAAIVYEFEGADADGRAIDIEIKAEGDSVVVLDDEDT